MHSSLKVPPYHSNQVEVELLTALNNLFFFSHSVVDAVDTAMLWIVVLLYEPVYASFFSFLQNCAVMSFIV